uniref:Uncharacterized protein n=1 Tax=Streptomyces sp. SANK 62799 TaxID=701528 RepID=E1CG29_9ACTN|nr:hypothetical protein [Streptomyces sp. SANK 62799]
MPDGHRRTCLTISEACEGLAQMPNRMSVTSCGTGTAIPLESRRYPGPTCHTSPRSVSSLGVAAARKSAPDILAWQLPAIDSLNTWIRQAVLALTGAGLQTLLRASAWAVHYRTGGFHEVHAHHDSAVSGVYYLRTAPDPTGALELADPRPARLTTEPPDPATSTRSPPTPAC